MRERYCWLSVSVVTCASVGMFLLGNVALAAETGPAQARIDPAAENAQMLKAESGYAVWLVSELDPETVRHRAQHFAHRFYLQRIGERDARLIYELGDGAVGFRLAVREDGSMLLEPSRGQLHFVPSMGGPVREKLEWLHCLNVYPDGLLALDWGVEDNEQRRPVYFVPFDGKRLRLKDRLKLVDAGVKRFTREEGLRYRAEPYRFGNVFAWVVDSTLHTFDLEKRHERKTVKLGTEMHPSFRVTAFDGATVICGVFAFDATTGQLLGEPEYSERPRNVASVFAVRNRIGYYYENGGLMATDLTSKDGRSIKLREAEAVVPIESREGLTVWDGKRWTLVPWLTELRRP